MFEKFSTTPTGWHRLDFLEHYKQDVFKLIDLLRTQQIDNDAFFEIWNSQIDILCRAGIDLNGSIDPKMEAISVEDDAVFPVVKHAHFDLLRRINSTPELKQRFGRENTGGRG